MIDRVLSAAIDLILIGVAVCVGWPLIGTINRLFNKTEKEEDDDIVS